MRRALYLVRHASGVYHFRLVLPPAARSAFGGRKVLKQSLRTHDLRTAQVLAHTLAARYAAALLRAKRLPVPNPPKLEDLLRAAERGELNPYTLRAGPSGVEIVANGPADHARALEAIGRLPPAAFIAPSTAPPTPPVEDITLAEALMKFSASLNPETPRKTRGQKLDAVSGLVNHAGTTVILSSVSRSHVARLFDWWRNDVGLETPTLNNKQSYLAGFFKWAKGAGYYHYTPGDNPGRGHVSYGDKAKRARRKLGFRAFTTTEVARLFDAQSLRGLQPRARWGAVMGLYLGARVSEIAQLALVDFDERDGVFCWTITDQGEGQSVKTEASVRTMPVHPHLLALGLRERVERLRREGQRDLLPHEAVDGAANGRGDWLSKSFGRYLAKHGVKSKEGAARVGFHSFRDTVIQSLKGCGMVAEVRADYVGHQLEGEHHEAYGRRLTPPEMLAGLATGPFKTAGLNALTYGLDLEALREVLVWEGQDTESRGRKTKR